MNKKKCIISVIFFVCILFIISAIYMVRADILSTNSALWFGGIRIQTHCYTLDENNERTEDILLGLLQPNEIIDYIIEVENIASPAYIRLKLTYPGSEQHPEKVLLDVSEEDWVYINGYYYYKTILNTQDTAVLCHKVKIPDIITNNQFTIQADAQAIQAENFTPDFAMDNPWGDIEIEDNMNKDEQDHDNMLRVGCNPDLNHVLSKNTIFTDIKNLMPGDTAEDEITITPDKDEYIYINVPEVEEIPKQADYIRFHIENNGNVIFDDTLYHQSLQDGFCLGKFEKGTTNKVSFTITLDEKLSNISAWQKVPAAFYFDYKVDPEITTETTEHPTTEDIPEIDDSDTDDIPDNTGIPDIVQTGDTSPVAVIICILCTCLVGIYYLYHKKL